MSWLSSLQCLSSVKHMENWTQKELNWYEKIVLLPSAGSLAVTDTPLGKRSWKSSVSVAMTRSWSIKLASKSGLTQSCIKQGGECTPNDSRHLPLQPFTWTHQQRYQQLFMFFMKWIYHTVIKDVTGIPPNKIIWSVNSHKPSRSVWSDQLILKYIPFSR